MFSILYTGFHMILTPSVFLLITAGTVLGVIFGAMPGVSASMAVALALPFAYGMAPETAVGFLAAVYSASITGGGITAILYRVPGTPSSAPTILDGYPMAQREGAGKALGFSLIASSAGGMIGALAMVLICLQLSAVAAVPCRQNRQQYDDIQQQNIKSRPPWQTVKSIDQSG